jgi:hypothetical protein
MSYASNAAMAGSSSLQMRITMCAATQDLGGFPPQAWAQSNILAIVSADGWAEKWEQAPMYNPDGTRTDTGARDDVITDDMILAAVQTVRNAQVAAQQAAADGSAS